MINEYDLYYREEIKVRNLPTLNYDIFLSAYTAAERVQVTYKSITATDKVWLLQPEYEFESATALGLDPPYFEGKTVCDEATFVIDFWDKYQSKLIGKEICIDITGFIRPTLLFLIRFLYEKGIRKLDLIYSEPDGYQKGESTQFASEEVSEVRTVEGYGGNHTTDTKKDILIVGAGYDHHLINLVAQDRDHARKFKLFGFPSLRADMFQENLLKVSKSEEYIGNISGSAATNLYAPAYDPFVAAQEISKLIAEQKSKAKFSNLYLSPLSTKPQTVGFALYYIKECIDEPVSVIFPFCERYNQSTSIGISRVWRYVLDF
tara:strand:- start:4139 stop:5095 length:957 start_codon:yes stop_codon:yes gene_type:complete